jgi:hypothetical protein
MTPASPPGLLVLHAVRILGFADTDAVARRFELDRATADELLLDAQANGWVAHNAFAGTAGWSLTQRGRAENERELAAELARTGREREVHEAYGRFLPLNGVVLRACTDWQLRPVTGNRLVPNDHADRTWDDDVLNALHGIDRDLSPLVHGLASVLARFHGYDTRFGAALARARAGSNGWVDRTDVDSCHRVWFELHEDLVATLGIERGATFEP